MPRPCAVSLPADAGARALAALDEAGIRLGPVVATESRVFLLVAPYSLAQLGELLHARDHVPGSLRLPQARAATSRCHPPGRGRERSWERAPAARLGRALGARRGGREWTPSSTPSLVRV
ncbi:hypothetical protein SALBM135S_01797 [Streptomyces alboniger]